MKKRQSFVANLWRLFEINEIEWDNCDTFKILYFLVAWVTFYNLQLSFLFADTMAPSKRYEQLSELVKMYSCLYNKQEKDFKKEEVKQRGWKEIAKKLDLENGKVVEQLWNNFRHKSACHLFVFTKEFFLLSVVIISIW